jgi:integrase
MFRGHVSAAANDLPFPPHRGQFDTTPTLSSEERRALEELTEAFARDRAIGPGSAHLALKRLTDPIDAALEWMATPTATRCATKRVMLIEMHRLDRPYWGWSDADGLDVASADASAFRARHGAYGSVRQQLLALICLFSGFDRLTEIGRFHRYHLAIKVFGRQAVDMATERVYGEVARVGHKGHERYGIAQVLHTAFLIEREARLETVTIGTLRRIANAGPRLLRHAASTLSRTLAGMGMIEGVLDHRIEAQRVRRATPGYYRATDGVAPAWVSWCGRWRAMAVSSGSSREKTYFGVLKFARWLAVVHPTIDGPAELTREVVIDYIAAVDRMKVGEWSNPTGNAARTLGKTMTATSKAAHLKMLRRFLGDLQEWEWIPKRFEPARVLAIPRPIASLIGPAPRMVADDIWAKIVWAGLNLEEVDLKPRAIARGRGSFFYPIELVRAVAQLWLFGGLRSDDIHRLPVGCIRWQRDREADADICLLDVPVGKTATAFTKPVDALIGKAIGRWEAARFAHPKMLDAKTGAMVDFLFVHRGRRVSKSYINETLIPLICTKAGVPQVDARGPITSHRARSTIATQLYNAKEPLTLFELKDWLGHADVRATQHYAALSPTKLAAAFRRAGYFERNLRTIAVLVDGDAVRSGAAAAGEPWRYYDLGHGLCTYDFFDQCPHRMACAKCSFYVPKQSARVQALEAKSNLARMLQDIPLLEEERAAVEDGLEAMKKLADGLRETATPDGRTPDEIAVSTRGDASPLVEKETEK